MKILLLTALAASLSMAAGPALAQDDDDNPVRRVYFDHVKPDMDAEFREVASDWNECLEENDAESGWSAWSAQAGMSYRYAFVIDADGWARFDEDDPAHEKCYGQMAKRYGKTIESAYSQFDQPIESASYHVEQDAEASVVMVINFRIKDARTFIGNAVRIAEAARAAEYPYPYYWWASTSGKHGPTHYVVVPRENYAAFGDAPDFWAAITEELGQDTMDEIRRQNMAVIASSWEEIWTHDEELSYEPED